MNWDRVTAIYCIETPLPLDQAAAILAGEQSSGTFVAVPGESDALRARFGARVESLEPIGESSTPSLPGSRATTDGPRVYRQARLAVSWSVENFGTNLSALVSTVAGNLFELSQLSGLKLIDLQVPASYAASFRGPAFGAAGTRVVTGVEGRPLIGTIIKPSVGLSPGQTASLVRTLAEAGIDFIKDDELMANPPHSPFDERVAAVMRVINDHADRTGKRVMYAFNLTDDLDAMHRHYDTVLAHRGSAVMISVNAVGIAGVRAICDRGQLPVHGHRNGWGMLTRHESLGVAFPAYQAIWRLAGVDQLHVNGIANKFWESDDSVVRSIDACRTPMPTREGRLILPVVSSGQTGLQAPETYRRTQTVDLLYLAGGGILAHPDGPAAGVESLRQAWEAAIRGESLESYAQTRPSLRRTLEKFAGGSPKE
jgi:ribulose-bisphosphate carboxylase large chain